MCLVVDVLLLTFFVHAKDLILPLLVCTRYANANVGNDVRISQGNSLSHGVDQDPSFGFVVAASCKFCLPLQFVEIYMGGVFAHAHLLHLFLVYFFDGGVMELFTEDFREDFPAGISISRTGFILILVVRDIPVGVPEVDPPVLGGSWFKEGGGKHHHLGIEGEVLLERLEVRLTVSQESVYVIVLALELGGEQEEDGLDPGHWWHVIEVPFPHGSMFRWSSIAMRLRDQEHVSSWSRSW